MILYFSYSEVESYASYHVHGSPMNGCSLLTMFPPVRPIMTVTRMWSGIIHRQIHSLVRFYSPWNSFGAQFIARPTWIYTVEHLPLFTPIHVTGRKSKATRPLWLLSRNEWVWITSEEAKPVSNNLYYLPAPRPCFYFKGVRCYIFGYVSRNYSC